MLRSGRARIRLLWLFFTSLSGHSESPPWTIWLSIRQLVLLVADYTRRFRLTLLSHGVRSFQNTPFPRACTSAERFPLSSVGICDCFLLLPVSTAMLSQFYVLSPRGDCLITKDYRNDAPKGAAEIFYRHVASWQFPSSASSADFSSSVGASGLRNKTAACSKGALASGGMLMMMNRGGLGGSGASEASPLFCVNGVTFAFLRRSGLYFVLTTQQNPSPALLFELLHRLTKIIQVSPKEVLETFGAPGFTRQGAGTESVRRGSSFSQS